MKDMISKEDLKVLIGGTSILIFGFIYELFQECYEIVYKVFHGVKSPWVDDDELW